MNSTTANFTPGTKWSTDRGTAAAVPVLRRRFADRPNAFRVPGGLLIPGAAILLTMAFAASTTTANLLAGGAALVVGAILYRLRRRPEGAVDKRLL